MARHDHSDDPGAETPPANDLTDDVKRLLDQLAGQICDADQRHAHNLQNMQVRLAALSDRAAAAKPELPDESAEAFGRVEKAISTLAGRLADADLNKAPTDSPADGATSELPEEVRADLRRAIAEGQREGQPAAPAQRSERRPAADRPAEKAPASNYPYVGPHAPAQAAVPPSASEAPAIERAWLEDRFTEIAERVESSMARLDRHSSFEAINARFDQFEQRFAVVLDATPPGSGPDAGTLRGIEKQITELFAELDRTRTQLGRLDTIESRLTELRQDASDENISRLFRAASPTDAQLSAVAMAAAECVAERIRGAMPAGEGMPDAAQALPGADPRLGELITIMQNFIGEHRTGDAQTAEALDTMQQAMQHLIDRVEAIEAAQITGHDELMRIARSTPAPGTVSRHEPLDFGFRDQDLRPAAGALGTDELPSIAVVGPAAVPDDNVLRDPHRAPPPPDHEERDRDPAAIEDTTTDASPAANAPHASPQGEAANTGEPHREAFIAMARRAAAKAAREPAPHSDVEAPERAPGAFGWARQLAAYRPSVGTAGPARRPRILLVASFAAFLLAGFWMLAGSGLRGIIPGIGSVTPGTPTKSIGMNGAGPADDANGRPAPSPGVTRNRFPGLGRVVDGGFGITIDERPSRTAPSAPAAMPKAREQVQFASVSSPATPDEMQKAVAGPESTEDSGPVEMPPATIGPLSLRHAAANGDPNAQFEVASRFAEAKGVPKDFAQAATWYQRAATRGLAIAQFKLGQLYDRGLGVASDRARARVWYGRAAEQGNVHAMHNLAVFSADRPGASPDYPTAVQWFTEAANRGLADSQYNLAILYERGLGVPENLAEAYKWYALAARTGDKGAAQRRDVLRNKLDPANVSAVDTLVIKWRAKPLDPAANDPRAGGLGVHHVTR